MRLIAFITEAPVIESILTCPGEATTPPWRPPAAPPLWDAEIDQTPIYDPTNPETMPAQDGEPKRIHAPRPRKRPEVRRFFSPDISNRPAHPQYRDSVDA
jgi:hypothetical protein